MAPDDDVLYPTLAGAGRDHIALLRANLKLHQALEAEADPMKALTEAFPDIAQGFGAERAVLLQPTEDPPFHVVDYRGEISPAQLAAISRGESAPGVSSTTIRGVLEKRHPAVVEHPMHRKGPRLTASLADNYSVLCGPVCSPTGEVRAILYFQNFGPSYERAYAEPDAYLLRAFTHLAEAILNQREQGHLSDLLKSTLARDKIHEEIDKEVIAERLKLFPDDYDQAAKSLEISRTSLYRLIDQYGLKKRRDLARLERIGEEIEREVQKPTEPER